MVAFERGSRGADLSGFREAHACALTVGTIRNAGAGAEVPEESGRGEGCGVVMEVEAGLLAFAAVHRRPELLDVVRRVGAGDPVVSVGADFGVVIEIVEKDEVARK